MNFDKIRRCSCGGTLNLYKCPTDPNIRDDIAELFYTPGVVYKELYHVTCHHNKISTGSFGRTLEEAVEKWNTGRTCQEVWSKEELELGVMNWPTCDCGCERVHLTTENRNNEWVWQVYCDDCYLFTELYDTLQEAIDAFKNNEVS